MPALDFSEKRRRRLPRSRHYGSVTFVGSLHGLLWASLYVLGSSVYVIAIEATDKTTLPSSILMIAAVCTHGADRSLQIFAYLSLGFHLDMLHISSPPGSSYANHRPSRRVEWSKRHRPVARDNVFTSHDGGLACNVWPKYYIHVGEAAILSTSTATAK